MSNYKEALEKAGATVHDFEEFGSYQGDWWAVVTFNGKTGFVNDCYGSCSGCDAFEADVGYNATDDQIAAFGLRYLEDDMILSYQEALGRASKNLSFDLDANSMVDFVKRNRMVEITDKVDKQIKGDD